MKVKVKFFSTYRDIFGRHAEDMEFPDNATVMDILTRLESEKPESAEYHNVMQIAVNWERATKKTPIQNGDEVALIPPVIGG
ncbi:MoaD/ThiS family protein [Candidatus Poribacteria bacterium]|nr:MoaD/ThiS family protein [Candidatus Poribacteria bacterium]